MTSSFVAELTFYLDQELILEDVQNKLLFQNAMFLFSYTYSCFNSWLLAW